MSLRILLIGSGGREHALAWKLSQSTLVEKIYVAPGNGGTYQLTKTINVSLNDSKFDELVRFAVENKVNLLLPGPEVPLVAGIVDYFKNHAPGIACFGPSQAAARLEGEKTFAKEFMSCNNIPTAKYVNIDSFKQGKQYLETHKDTKWVIKADGVAAGKGVILPQSHEEAVQALSMIMEQKDFGAAGDKVVIEEFLQGEELSVLSFSDGYTIRSLPAAQDHKQVFDGDQGPNTGGMGCYAPAPIATPELMELIHRECLMPTIDNLRNSRVPFVGCLFTGFMVTKDGPKVLEYNTRFGDPETQTVLPLLENDLADVLLACTGGYLSSIDLKLKSGFSTTVVVAAGGYPGKYDKGTPMTLDTPEPDTVLFHAGTKLDPSSQPLTAGGRVIAATSIGSNISQSVERAYRGVKCIHFDRMHFRKDIAHRELKRQSQASSSVTNGPLSYASAGVSIDAGNDLVQRIKSLVASTARPGADAQIGGFGGEFSLSAAGYGATAPTLVCAIDGIGTKLMIARAVNDLSSIGIDLVAMNVNDLVVQGAEPLAFLDYYACSKLHVDDAAAFVQGVVEGCRTAGCALVGGETAEMPGIYHGLDFDAAGCAIGALAHGQAVLPQKKAMQEGDVLLGLRSSGVHSNGFSLVRRVLAQEGLEYSSPAPWDPSTTVGRSLLTPTKIYVKPLVRVLQAAKSAGRAPLIKGMAHITGGGIVENVPRMLPPDLMAVIDMSQWDIPNVFKWLYGEGKRVDGEDMMRTLNVGIGMVLVVASTDVAAVQAGLRESGEDAIHIGVLSQKSKGSTASCLLQNKFF